MNQCINWKYKKVNQFFENCNWTGPSKYQAIPNTFSKPCNWSCQNVQEFLDRINWGHQQNVADDSRLAYSSDKMCAVKDFFDAFAW